MKVKIEVPCQSNWYLEHRPFKFTHDGNDFELLVNSDSNVYRIRVQKSIEATASYFAEIRQINEGMRGTPQKFLIPSADKELIDALKFFENVMCVEGDLIINWRGLVSSHTAESDSEKSSQDQSGGYQGWGRIIHMPGKVTIKETEALTCRLEYSQGLDIELGFYRHAFLAAKEENFIEAYFNYYLILESYFSGGRHKYQGKTFKKNAALLKVITDLLLEEPFKKLISATKLIQPYTPENIIDRLVEVRQKIFHFLDVNKPQRRITYHEQEELKEDIPVLNAIVWRSMRERHKLINQPRSGRGRDERRAPNPPFRIDFFKIKSKQ